VLYNLFLLGSRPKNSDPGQNLDGDPDPDPDAGGGGEGVGQPNMCIPPGKILGTPLTVYITFLPVLRIRIRDPVSFDSWTRIQDPE
jgi:hypothetical protein